MGLVRVSALYALVILLLSSTGEVWCFQNVRHREFSLQRPFVDRPALQKVPSALWRHSIHGTSTYTAAAIGSADDRYGNFQSCPQRCGNFFAPHSPSPARRKWLKLAKFALIAISSVVIIINFGAVAHATSAITEEVVEAASEIMPEAAAEVLAPAAAAASTGVKAKSVYVKKATKFFRKAGRILKNLLDGANMKGSARKWKAGDTRTELGMILNVFSTLVMWGLVGGAATFVAAMRDAKFERRRKSELNKVQEYKENMYFEAVEEVLRKLADPKLKGSARANLTKQLKDIDPDGKIQKFVAEGGDRPDLTGMMGKKPAKKKKRKTWGSEKERPPPKKKSPKTEKDKDEDRENQKPKSKANKNPSSAPTPPSRRNTTFSYSYSSVSMSFQTGPSNPYARLLNNLYDSLEGVLPDERRMAVCEYIDRRLGSISNEAKRETAALKISEKLGDEEYWTQFADSYDL